MEKEKLAEIKAMLAARKKAKAEKLLEEKKILEIVRSQGYNTMHLRGGVVSLTILYQRLGEFEYVARVGFCGPKDTFCKREGRIQAFRNRGFKMYRTPGDGIEMTVLKFLAKFIVLPVMDAKQRKSYEEYYNFPRWLAKHFYAIAVIAEHRK